MKFSIVGVISLALSVVLCGCAERTVSEGVVLDDQSGKPVADAKVGIKSFSAADRYSSVAVDAALDRTQTDAEGRFRIKASKGGKAFVIIWKADYYPTIIDPDSFSGQVQLKRAGSPDQASVEKMNSFAARQRLAYESWNLGRLTIEKPYEDWGDWFQRSGDTRHTARSEIELLNKLQRNEL